MPVGTENSVIKLAIRKLNTNAVYVVIDNILEGVDGATRVAFSNNLLNPTKYGDGNEAASGEEVTVSFTGYFNMAGGSTTEIDFFQGLNEGDEVEITAITMGLAMYYIPSALIVNSKMFQTGSRFHYKLTMTRQANGFGWTNENNSSGGGDFTGSVLLSNNMLDKWDTRSGSGTGSVPPTGGDNGYLYGFVSTTDHDTSESGGVMYIKRNSGTGTLCRSGNVLFPFVGMVVQASMYADTSYGNGYKFGLRFIDEAGSTSDDQSNTSTTTGATVSHQATIPSGTVRVTFTVRGDNTVGDGVGFSAPSLTIVTL